MGAWGGVLASRQHEYYGEVEKPKVYQGVRVKMTVKELLQQRRAHQATSGATTPGSPSDSSSLSGSFDCSYSPAQPPSYTLENYTSPPPLDSLNHSLPEEGYACHHHWPSHTQYNHFSPATPSVCYCASCEAEHLDAVRTSEFFSYSNTDYVDFAPSAATTSDFYKRETSCDACYS
ncbi:COLCA2 homolog [Cricetulus griseus]